MNKIYKGDCLDLMPIHIKDKTIDLIFADLPYGTTNCKWDSNINLTELWNEYKRVLKDTGVVLLFAQTPFDKVLGASNLKMLRYEWIWEKTQATGHLNAKKMPMKAHENILVFYNKLPTYNYIKTKGHVRKVASKKSRDKCIERTNEKESYLYNKQDVSKNKGYDSTERYPRSVLKFPSDKQKSSLHPTQKPIDLLKYMIKTYSNPGDLVLDNVAGSGSTGLACKELGRNFILMEKEENYYKTCINRLK